MQGTVSDPVQKLDRLLAYMFVADASQTYVYSGHVVSVQKLRELHYGDPEAFANALQSKTNTYLKNHFEQVAISTTLSDVVGNGEYTLALVVRVVDASQTYSSTWRYNASDSKFVKVATVANNGG